MALPTKTDHVGLAATGIELSDNDLGKSATFLEKNGANGDFVANEYFGEVADPKCDYKITALTEDFTRNLGHVYGSGTTPYALQSFSVTTSAGGEPKMTANAKQIEASATNAAHVFATSEIDLSPYCHAQTFGAFTYTESSTLALQDSTYTATCDLKTTTINGVVRASDAVSGKETVSATFWSASDTAPAVTAATGWVQSAPLTCTGADGDLYTWTCEWTKHLTASTPST